MSGILEINHEYANTNFEFLEKAVKGEGYCLSLPNTDDRGGYMTAKKETFEIDNQSRAISAKEAAAILGVSESTVYRMFKSGELPSFKIRNSRRTSTAVCEDYIRKQQAREAILCRIRNA